jgi:hypothetical protein
VEPIEHASRVVDPAWFIRPDGRDASLTIHGVAHADRVRVHAREIAQALGLSEGECLALDYAAMWHDIGRTHDGVDYYHGAKSAGKVVGLGLHLELDADMLETVLFVVTHHCGSEEHARRGVAWTPDPDVTLRVFEVFKDADALDRVRLGHGDLDPGMLRHDISRERVDGAWELLREIR